MFGKVGNVLLLLALELVDVVDQSFNRIVEPDEFFCRLFSNSRNAGDVVGGITPKSEDINHLFGRFDLPFFKDGREVEDFVIRSLASGFPHRGSWGD